MSQQRKDGGHQLCGGPRPIARGALRGGEGMVTARTAIAVLNLTMHANVPRPHLSSGLAVRVGAELGLRVYRWPPLGVIRLSQAIHVRQEARRTRFF